MKKNRSLEANLEAAKKAAHEMVRYWNAWKSAKHAEGKTNAVAGYTAAFTNCKVYVENYLRQLYPNENQVPTKVAQDIRKLVSEMDAIDKVNDKKLNRAIHDIDQLGKDAA